MAIASPMPVSSSWVFCGRLWVAVCGWGVFFTGIGFFCALVWDFTTSVGADVGTMVGVGVGCGARAR